MYCVSDVVFDFCKSDVFVFLVRRGSIGKNGGDAGAKLEIHRSHCYCFSRRLLNMPLLRQKQKAHGKNSRFCGYCIFALAVLFLKLANTEA